MLPATHNARSGDEHGLPESERRYVTLLFADISGFMTISEQLDAEDVTAFINGCFERLEGVVIAHGGVVDKYIGDCLVAVFGLTVMTDDPTGHAVRAAIEMREALQQFNRDAQPPSPLDVHIGISSGPVIAGFVGGGAKRAFTVIGDTVNLASYLEHASGKGQIFVGPETWRATQTDFEYRPLAAAHLDGVPEPIPIFELTGVRPSRRVKRDSERRQATVLFADVLGFRALAARMDAEALTRLINECLATIADAVVERGGVIDKYIGECVMALFGVPNAIENAPQQAINAAIEIRSRVATFVERHGLPSRLDVRVGLNTGLVIAGEIGGRVKRDFTVMGDTVNVATRLKEAAGAGEIYVGAGTHRYTRDEFEFASLPPLAVKGKERAVQAYRLHSVTGRVHRTRSERPDRTIYSPLVGRDAEFATIAGAIRDVADGRGGILSVIGEAGIGKSRLMMEVLRATEGVAATFLKARSISLGQGLSPGVAAGARARSDSVQVQRPASKRGDCRLGVLQRPSAHRLSRRHHLLASSLVPARSVVRLSVARTPGARVPGDAGLWWRLNAAQPDHRCGGRNPGCGPRPRPDRQGASVIVAPCY